MAALLVPVVLVAAVLVVIAMLMRRFGKAHTRHVAHLEDESTPDLRYRVPAGQDPIVVLQAVRRAGYDAAADHTGVVLLIGTDGSSAARERVREVLADIQALNVEGDRLTPGDGMVARGPVRFIDE